MYKKNFNGFFWLKDEFCRKTLLALKLEAMKKDKETLKRELFAFEIEKYCFAELNNQSCKTKKDGACLEIEKNIVNDFKCWDTLNPIQDGTIDQIFDCNYDPSTYRIVFEIYKKTLVYLNYMFVHAYLSKKNSNESEFNTVTLQCDTINCRKQTSDILQEIIADTFDISNRPFSKLTLI